MIYIIDYGMGNIGSIKNMLKRVGKDSRVISDPRMISGASRIILPGVGSFDAAVKALKKTSMFEAIKVEVLEKKTPITGICLGMQLLTESSDEGVEKGFGFIKGKALSFKSSLTSNEIKVPHMGWNKVFIKKENIFFDQNEINKFYFVHSYFVVCEHEKDVLTKTDYAGEFVSSFEKEHISGFQFHPEKSHRYGVRLFSVL